MRLQMLSGALALAGTTAAFSDSSPWVLLSTSPFSNAPDASTMQTSSRVLEDAKTVLSECSTDKYLMISQPGVNAADLVRSDHTCSMRHLCRAVEDPRIKSKSMITEVVGDVSGADLASYVQQACATKGKDVAVDELNLSSPSTSNRLNELIENDILISQSLEDTTARDSYTVVFYSTPAEPAYEADFDDSIRTELKRQLQNSPQRRADNNTDWEKLPLFEAYQFFTPGVIMGLIVAIILFSILGVGLKALGSLEVSYGAFEKDMGPAAQKKQM